MTNIPANSGNDPLFQVPPPLQTKGSGTGKRWLMGCGAGCLVVLLIVAGVGVFGFLKLKTSMQERQPALAKELDTQYQKLKESGRVPEDKVVEYDAFVEIVEKPGNSIFMTSLGMGIVLSRFSGNWTIADFPKRLASVVVTA